MTSVLFVCLGNICRSPAAEGIFRQRLEQLKISRIDSAGTGDWHVGKSPDKRMQSACAERGVDISQQRARQFTSQDFSQFEHIIVMDESNRANVERLASNTYQGKAKLLSDFCDSIPRDVPDPYYGGQDGFENCLDIIEQGIDGLIRHLQTT